MTTPRVTVPVEPTQEMLVAGARAVGDFYSCGGPYPRAKAMYRAMLSAAPAPEGGAAEDLREALVQADLKIRSLPGTDQSDVEFIREALATREEAPAEAGEPSLVDWFSQFIERHQEGCGSDTDALIACLDRVRDSYRSQLPTRERAPAEELVNAELIARVVLSAAPTIKGGWDTAYKIADAVLALRAQPPAREDALRAAVEVLEWYGEQARLARLIHSEGDAGRHALADDGGKRARQALAALQAEQKGGA